MHRDGHGGIAALTPQLDGVDTLGFLDFFDPRRDLNNLIFTELTM